VAWEGTKLAIPDDFGMDSRRGVGDGSGGEVDKAKDRSAFKTVLLEWHRGAYQVWWK
jgi:hypothetical protein